jgi:hypothetical protein
MLDFLGLAPDGAGETTGSELSDVPRNCIM